jgi:SAM-dependent methyltransferase
MAQEDQSSSVKGAALDFTGERAVPGMISASLYKTHASRYEFAASLCSDAVALDVACGSGYGTRLLNASGRVRLVISVDISHEALLFAKRQYPELHVVQANASALPFKNDSFDLIASFETIEHLDATNQEKLLHQCQRVARDDGILVISTPNKKVYSFLASNPFHLKEHNLVEFKQFIQRGFEDVRLFGQDRRLYPVWILRRTLSVVLSVFGWGNSVRQRVRTVLHTESGEERLHDSYGVHPLRYIPFLFEPRFVVVTARKPRKTRVDL